MGIGAIVVNSPGTLAAASTLPIAVSSAISVNSSTALFHDYGLSDVIPLPSLKAVLFTDGIGFPYHFIDAVGYLTGPLAPGVAPDAASTAVRATVVMTFTGTPGNGSIVQIGKPGSLGNGGFIWKTTLDPAFGDGSIDQVLIGGSAAAAITNLRAFINGTGVNGTGFQSWRVGQYGPDSTGNGFYWDTSNDI